MSGLFSRMTSLWMGDLEPFMDESFVMNSFSSAGIPAINVKVIKNRATGAAAGYCFVDFGDPAVVDQVMRKINGKPLPGSSGKKFKLNYPTKDQAMSPEFSLFVGDLTSEVDDASLYQFFSSRYPSCRAAKVVVDSAGNSKGYGFVRFATEDEQHKALYETNNRSGIGGKPIRVSLATPKNNMSATRPGQQQGANQQHNSYDNGQQYYQQYNQYANQYYNQYDPNQYANQYGNYYSNWGNYSAAPGAQGYHSDPNQQQYAGYPPQEREEGYSEAQGSGENLEDPNQPVDVEKANAEFIKRSEELYGAIEKSRWQLSELVKPEPPAPSLE